MIVKKSVPAADDAKAKKFNELIKPITDGMEKVQIAVVASVGLGDMYKTIEGVEGLKSDDKVNIDAKGQAMLIDFWATWCPPCQGPMKHNQEMLEKRGADWEGKVRIIGLSIDQDKAKLNSHLESKGW